MHSFFLRHGVYTVYHLNIKKTSENIVTNRVFWTPQSLLIDIQYSSIALQQQNFGNSDNSDYNLSRW